MSSALSNSAGLRVPQIPEGPAQPKVLIDQLLEYTLKSAWHQGELAQARLEAYLRLEPLENQWDELSGWQGLVKAKTDKGINEAKRTINPDLYKKIRAGRFLISRLSDEIDRLERDATKVSRAYSILSGS